MKENILPAVSIEARTHDTKIGRKFSSADLAIFRSLVWCFQQPILVLRLTKAGGADYKSFVGCELNIRFSFY